MEERAHAGKSVDVFREEFRKETDRASVILASAMVERALGDLLRARLVPSPSAEDSVFDSAYGPLSTFSARIDVAYRIGLISLNLYRDLHIIRRIRNGFAHDIHGCTFEDLSVLDRIAALMRSSGYADRAPRFRASCFSAGPRGDFELTISWILWCLHWRKVDIKPIEPADPEFGYTGGDDEDDEE